MMFYRLRKRWINAKAVYCRYLDASTKLPRKCKLLSFINSEL